MVLEDDSATVAPVPADRRTAYVLVTIQMVLLAALVALPRGDTWSAGPVLLAVAAAGAVAGLGLVLVGGTALGRGLTAVPIPNAHAVLRTGGLYRWVRHPIYSGVLLVGASVTLAAGDAWRLLVLGLLLALFTVKSRWEETRLAERFPDYPAYAARTPRFLPRLRRRP
jgi:protein-S-isoprenylcysteine O-methyltransferase Ste14